MQVFKTIIKTCFFSYEPIKLLIDMDKDWLSLHYETLDILGIPLTPPWFGTLGNKCFFVLGSRQVSLGGEGKVDPESMMQAQGTDWNKFCLFQEGESLIYPPPTWEGGSAELAGVMWLLSIGRHHLLSDSATVVKAPWRTQAGSTVHSLTIGLGQLDIRSIKA